MIRQIAKLLIGTTSLILCACQPATEIETPTPTATVRVAAASLQSMSNTIELYGSADFAPQQQHALYATGDVVIEQIMVVRGQTVAKGQPLMTLRPNAAAILERRKAAIDLASTGQELRRVRRLFVEQLATNADINAAEQNHASARAAADSAIARTPSATSYSLSSSFDGQIASVDAAQGDQVVANSALLHLADSRGLIIRLAVEPSDLKLLAAGESVRIIPVYDSQVIATGTITELVAQIDSQTRLAQALVSVADTSALLPGSMVRAEVETEHRDSVLVIPRSALLWSGNKIFVYTVSGAVAHRVEITTGIEQGDRVEILSGLQVNDQIAVEGNYALEDGMAVKFAGEPSPL